MRQPPHVDVDQDLEEVEEWNEYGELKEKVGSSTAAVISSAANTPSKAPPNTPATPSQPVVTGTPSNLLSALNSSSQPTSPSNTESPMTTAMRKAGFEAARKAGDAKSRATQNVLGGSRNSRGTQKKLDSTGADEISASSGSTGSKVGYDDGADPETDKVIPRVDTAECTVTKQESGASDNVVIALSKATLNDKDETVAERSKEANDPDKEAVVPGTKDTVKVNDEDEAGSMDESNDPDQEAVGPISKGKAGMTDTDDADDAESARDSEDPDKEAVVPESRERI
ncbi:MAG: hypothetical protein Q9167_004727 [Letrouitia subvulpina]